MADLFEAVRVGNLDRIKILIGSGMSNSNTNVLEKGKDGRTALHLASELGNLEIVELLIREGYNILEKDNYGLTALHIASFDGRLEMVKLLIELGSDVLEKANFGYTAFHLASTNDYLEIVELLVSAGSNILEKNDEGLTALHMASHNGYFEVVKRLVKYYIDINADINTVNNDGCTAIDIARTDEIREFLMEQLEIQQNSYVLK